MVYLTFPRLFQLEVGALTVPLPVEFCGVEYDGCKGASPACSNMGPSQPVQLCSSLTVPTESPDVSADHIMKSEYNNVSVPGRC